MTAPATTVPSAATRGWRLLDLPLWLGFCWGAAEATFFFVVPDLVITLAALFSLRRAAGQLAVVVAGSIVGGLLLYSLAGAHHGITRAVVEDVPFVRPAMFERVSRDLDTHGVWGLCEGPLSGIPYKVYAVQAAGRIPPVTFALVSIPARLERLLVSLALFAAVGWICRRYWPGMPALPLTFYTLYWLGVYGYYWSTI